VSIKMHVHVFITYVIYVLSLAGAQAYKIDLLIFSFIASPA